MAYIMTYVEIASAMFLRIESILELLSSLVLQIRRGERDNLGIIFHITS